jgi:iron complex outermembrane receptor protein
MAKRHRYHRPWYALLLIIGLLTPPPPAIAASSPPPGEEAILFQEIPSVFSASKYEQKVTEAPSAVSIVTAAEIRRYGYRTLADLLRSLRSFHLSFERTNEALGVRGFNRPGDSNSRVLLLVNGHRVNDNIFLGATTGNGFILDVDLIDRVEVVRGPSSSLYGTSAFFAVVNVITRRGRDLKGAEVAAEAGSHESWRGRLSYGERLASGLEMLFSGTRYESDGNGRLYFPEFDSPDTNNGIAEDADREEFHSLFTRMSLLDFTLEGAYIDREKGIPTAPFGTVFNDPRTRGEVRQAYGRLSYEHRFASQLDVQAAVSYNLFHSDGDFAGISEDATPFLVVNKDEFRGEWWGGEMQISKQLWERHRLSLGGEYQDNFRQDLKNFDLEVFLSSRNRSDNWGVYLQDEIQLRDNLLLNLGVRHDHYDSFGGTTNPRLALIYSPLAKTTFKLLYGEAFRAPNAFESLYHDGFPNNPFSTQKPNPDLDPEKITTYELVCEQYLGDHLRAVAAAFYYEIDDLINIAEDPDDLNAAGDPRLVFRNLDEVEATGAEFELEGKWDRGLEGRVSYTYQEAKDRKTDMLLSNSPRHLAKVNLIVPLIGDKLLLGVEEQYTSSRKTVIRGETGGYAVTNLTLFGRKLYKELQVSASVYNLFDKKFSDPASLAHRQETIEQDGRIFRFKLAYAF